MSKQVTKKTMGRGTPQKASKGAVRRAEHQAAADAVEKMLHGLPSPMKVRLFNQCMAEVRGAEESTSASVLGFARGVCLEVCRNEELRLLSVLLELRSVTSRGTDAESPAARLLFTTSDLMLLQHARRFH